MTLTRSFTVTLKATSSASEADISSHLDYMTAILQHKCQTEPKQDWYSTISTSWDERYKCDFEVQIENK